LGAIDQKYGKDLIPRLDPKVGTPFNTIVEAIQPTCKYPLREVTYILTDAKALTKLLDDIESGLKYGVSVENKVEKRCTNACTIIKLNRASGVGHTVIMSFENGRLYTVDPQSETEASIALSGKGRLMRERKNDEKLFDVWTNTGGFVSVSVIMGKVHKTQSGSSDSMLIDSGVSSESSESPSHGNKPVAPWLGNKHRTSQPYLGDPVDLTERGSVYSIIAHGSMAYKMGGSDDGNMPHDKTGKPYDIECLTIPRNIVILTLTSIGENLAMSDHRGSTHLRASPGLPYLATMGKFRYERWGAPKGKSHFQFPNYNLQAEYSPSLKSAMGVYQRTGPHKSDMRRIVNLENNPVNKQVPMYDSENKLIALCNVMGQMESLRDAIEIIKRDAGGGKIYIFCIFCLGYFAPVSIDKIRRCCDSSSIDLTLPGKTISSKKKSRRRRKRKTSRR